MILFRGSIIVCTNTIVLANMLLKQYFHRYTSYNIIGLVSVTFDYQCFLLVTVIAFHGRINFLRFVSEGSALWAI